MRKFLGVTALFGAVLLTGCSASNPVSAPPAPTATAAPTPMAHQSPDPCLADQPCRSAEGITATIDKIEGQRWESSLDSRGINAGDPQVVVHLTVRNDGVRIIDVVEVEIDAQDRVYEAFTPDGWGPQLGIPLAIGEQQSFRMTFAGVEGRGSFDGQGLGSGQLTVRPADLKPIVFPLTTAVTIPTPSPTPRATAARSAKPSKSRASSNWDKNGNGVCDPGEELPPAQGRDGKWSDASEHGCQYDIDLQEKMDREEDQRYGDSDGDGIPDNRDDSPYGSRSQASKVPTLVRPTQTGTCPAGTGFSPRKGRCVTYCEEFPGAPDC